MMEQQRIAWSTALLSMVTMVLVACAGPGEAPPALRAPLERKTDVPLVTSARPEVPVVAAPDREALAYEHALRELATWSEHVRQMSPAELGKVFSRGDPPADAAARVRYALALGHTRNPADTVRALGLLEPLLRSTDPANQPWRMLASLLAATFTERRRVEELAERQAQQLRESQRRQEQLSQQLEALKAIERSLTQRSAPALPSLPASPPTPPQAPNTPNTPPPAAPPGKP